MSQSRRARNEARGVHAGFLDKLAARGGLGVLALIEAALRHLPPRADPLRRAGAIGSPPDKDAAFGVDEHHADARPVGQPLLFCHGRTFSFAAATAPPH